MNKNKKKFKFSKFKVIRNLSVLTILGIIFFALKTNAYNEINYKTIIVYKGQTLWEIAREEKKYNNYYKSKDIRYIIRNIKKINCLSSSIIYENQKLQIIDN